MKIRLTLFALSIDTGARRADTGSEGEPVREVEMGSLVERAPRHPIGFRIDPPGPDPEPEDRHGR